MSAATAELAAAQRAGSEAARRHVAAAANPHAEWHLAVAWSFGWHLARRDRLGRPVPEGVELQAGLAGLMRGEGT